MISTAYRSATLERFEKQRETWSENAALRTLYAYWYAEVREALAPVLGGQVVEIGSGAGLAKAFLPGIHMSDTVKAAWHDYEIDATRSWPFGDRQLDGILVFDVLHHLASPRNFFNEALRTLKVGGYLVIMEPYVSFCSYPVYRFLHDEGLDNSVEPLAPAVDHDKDPFAGNQALPGLLFGRFFTQFREEFPGFRVVRQEFYSGLSYLASGGFSRRCPLPYQLWRLLLRIDRNFPRPIRRFAGFRMLISLERVGDPG